MQDKFFYAICVIILILILVKVVGLQKISKPLLVIDRHDVALPPKQFRSIKMLNASGSGQFTAQELQELIKELPANFWVIDLRQESHGFINGIPVSWYGFRNNTNLNKQPEHILEEEQRLLAEIATQPTAILHIPKKISSAQIVSGGEKLVNIERVETEQQLAHRLNLNYHRFFVLDHHKPSAYQVDKFIEFVDTKVKTTDWLHFHCRGGKGRSTLFLALYDIIRNAQNLSFDEIIKRQVEFGGINLAKVEYSGSKKWKEPAAQDRYNFIKRFYDYVVDPAGYKTISWSEWLRS